MNYDDSVFATALDSPTLGGLGNAAHTHSQLVAIRQVLETSPEYTEAVKVIKPLYAELLVVEAEIAEQELERRRAESKLQHAMQDR